MSVSTITKDSYIKNLLLLLHQLGQDVSISSHMKVKTYPDSGKTSVVHVYTVTKWTTITKNKYNYKTKKVVDNIVNIPESYNFKARLDMSLFLIEMLKMARGEKIEDSSEIEVQKENESKNSQKKELKVSLVKNSVQDSVQESVGG
jgi:hypothetical protein